MAQITFPVGRMIGGDLYKLEPVLDDDGKPKIKSDGTEAKSCSVGVAFKKDEGVHWTQTPWGAEIFKIGQAAYPAEHASLSFAWKVTDGDSSVPNKKGRAPNANENYRGHWVLWFSQSWLPELYATRGGNVYTALVEPNAILPGYYIKVLADVVANKPRQGAKRHTPGVYLNPSAIALVAEGERIKRDVDVSAFSTVPDVLPPGVIPLSVVGGPSFAPAVAGFAAPVANPAFLQVPPPAAPRPPSAPVARAMTPAAQGATYAQMIELGWTDELLILHGMVQP